MQLVPRAVPVVGAKGSHIFLADGRAILDGISSWWVTLLGHCHPAISRAIAEQASTLDQVIFAGFTHEPASSLARDLVELAPTGLEKVFLSDNGSTAVEVALKLALQYWYHQGEHRTIFLALEDAYHGDTFGSMSVSSESVFTKPFQEHLFRVRRLPFPTPADSGDSMSEAESKFLDALGHACRTEPIAGFIYEPLLLGAGGMRSWRPEILSKALSIAKSHGVLCIADEVLTGFGRTGRMFASEYVSERPDLMTLSKGITGGFLPLGATLCTRTLFDAFLSKDRGRAFFHGHSYTGNPISCAAACATLQVMRQEPVFDAIEEIARIHTLLGPALAERHGMRMRHIGTVAAFSPETSAGYLSDRALLISAETLQRSLLIRPLGDVVYLLPPYSTTTADLERAYAVLDDVLLQISKS